MPEPLPKSLYAETAAPAPKTPRLDGSTRTSVAVVGGGYTGLSTALHLAERGVDVTVLEANEIGWGASGRNGGQVNPGLKPDPDDVERDFGPELGARMLTFSSDAPNKVFGLIARLGIDCDAAQTGTLRAAAHGRDAGPLHATFTQWQRRGAPVEFLDRDRIAAAAGTQRYRSAMLFRQGGQLNPLGYARGLAAAAMRAGACIFGQTRVKQATRCGTGWSLRTGSGDVQAEHLVLATNGYTDDLWPGLRQSVIPVFSAIAATAPLPSSLAASILRGRSVLYEIGFNTVYYRLDAQGRLLMGGRSPLRPISEPSEAGFLTRYALKLWPGLAATAWTHAWNGQIALTQDHYPHFHEPAENVHVSLGYNGRGIALSTVMGDVLARRILGAPEAELPMPITGLRRIPLHGLWRPAAASRLVYGRVRDALGL